MAPSKFEPKKPEGKLDNATQLGDPVSLKAETADSEPTKDDRGAGRNSDANQKSQSGGKGTPTDSKNPTMLGDPVSLDVESPKQGEKKKDSKL